MESHQLLQQIDAEREQLGLSIKAFCAKIDITPSYYHKMLRGESFPAYPLALSMIKECNLSLMIYKALK